MADNQTPFGLPPSTLKTTTWPKGLLIGIALIFILVLGSYFALNFYLKIQDKNLADLDKQIQTLRDSFPVEKQLEVLNFESRLKNLTTLLNNHRYLTKLFANLEQSTHPKIYFTDFNFDNGKMILTLKGIALNYTTIAEAMTAFNNNPYIDKADFKDFKLDQSGQANFTLELKIKPDLLKQ